MMGDTKTASARKGRGFVAIGKHSCKGGGSGAFAIGQVSAKVDNRKNEYFASPFAA